MTCKVIVGAGMGGGGCRPGYQVRGGKGMEEFGETSKFLKSLTTALDNHMFSKW